MDGLKSLSKSFDISKQEVWQDYLKAKADHGSAGVDGCSMEDFEKDLKNNLYRIWNRMPSGSYFPPPVLAVEIPKSHGGTRVLGAPTVADRIAQTVVAVRPQERVEPMFRPGSYGYRPNRSALDALERCRKQCRRFDWVFDLDIQAFFDSVPRDLIVKAVEANTDQSWIVLYVKRWLAADLQRGDGIVIARDQGTPQGSAVSPVLANLFLHYAFDAWKGRDFPTVWFERYVDDVVVHCRSQAQALMLVRAIGRRMEEKRPDCSYTLTRPGSSTAAMVGGRRKLRKEPRSIFSATRSGPGHPATARTSSSPGSFRPSLIMPASGSGTSCVPGGYRGLRLGLAVHHTLRPTGHRPGRPPLRQGERRGRARPSLPAHLGVEKLQITLTPGGAGLLRQRKGRRAEESKVGSALPPSRVGDLAEMAAAVGGPPAAR